MGSVAGTADRHVLRGHGLLRGRQRKLHHGPISAALCPGLLVHGFDVVAAGPLRTRLTRGHHSHQTVPGWSLVDSAVTFSPRNHLIVEERCVASHLELHMRLLTISAM